MVTTILLVILLLLIVELLVTRSSNRLSLIFGLVCLALWLVAVFKLFSGKVSL